MNFGPYSYGGHAEEDYKAILILSEAGLKKKAIISAQQACEKYLKDILVSKYEYDLSKLITHNLVMLAKQAEINLTREEKLTLKELQSDYFVLRYPSEEEKERGPVTDEDIKNALHLAIVLRSTAISNLECIASAELKKLKTVEKTDITTIKL